MTAARNAIPHRSIALFLAIVVLFALSCTGQSDDPATAVPAAPTAGRTNAVPTQTVAPEPRATPTDTPDAPSYPQIQFVENEDCRDISRERLPLAELIISDGKLEAPVIAEVASTSSQRRQGLMCRETVSSGTGMLFDFGGPTTSGFWMFNTYAPLDIVFLRVSEGVAVRQMLPCPREEGETTESWESRCAMNSADYKAGVTYTQALELPSGWLVSLGFDLENPGDLSIAAEAFDDR